MDIFSSLLNVHMGLMSAQLSRCVAVYSRHFVASRIDAPVAVVAVVFTLDHIVTTETTMGWTESYRARHPAITVGDARTCIPPESLMHRACLISVSTQHPRLTANLGHLPPPHRTPAPPYLALTPRLTKLN